jgi:hypothetical protein
MLLAQVSVSSPYLLNRLFGLNQIRIWVHFLSLHQGSRMCKPQVQVVFPYCRQRIYCLIRILSMVFRRNDSWGQVHIVQALVMPFYLSRFLWLSFPISPINIYCLNHTLFEVERSVFVFRVGWLSLLPSPRDPVPNPHLGSFFLPIFLGLYDPGPTFAGSFGI